MKYLLRSVCVCAFNIFALIESQKSFIDREFGLILNDIQMNNINEKEEKKNCDAVTVNFVVSMDFCLCVFFSSSSLSLFLCIQIILSSNPLKMMSEFMFDFVHLRWHFFYCAIEFNSLLLKNIFQAVKQKINV